MEEIEGKYNPFSQETEARFHETVGFVSDLDIEQQNAFVCGLTDAIVKQRKAGLESLVERSEKEIQNYRNSNNAMFDMLGKISGANIDTGSK